ncbi:MAG: phosphoribosyl-ATP pyrophosphatase [Anaerolineae bacterium SG8_19]|jgi:phosphoribosyl-ATP pyrophosphohydrolase|nr:MAG: phosphoribosyl-ATP pyrophosphatase [Anaerolineae bacterium SG8_19]
MIDKLFEIIEDRRFNPRSGSYTSLLFTEGEDVILKKVGEEAMEVILAAKAQGDERLVQELADLFYHSLVLLSCRGLSLEDLKEELRRRHNV